MPIQGFQLVFRADSGCSPIRMMAADCCNGDMSNANNNPQGGSAAGSAEPQSQPRPPMYQPQPNRGNRFFAWIRSSRITRGRNRWIAGVCDGVARRLGWNATLVRALVILTSLLFGAGAAFYALAWFLLPDETDGRILCEELVNGHWDWNCAGALVCAAVALCLPGAGWLAFGVAVLVFWLLVNRQSYAASWQRRSRADRGLGSLLSPFSRDGRCGLRNRNICRSRCPRTRPPLQTCPARQASRCRSRRVPRLPATSSTRVPSNRYTRRFSSR